VRLNLAQAYSSFTENIDQLTPSEVRWIGLLRNLSAGSAEMVVPMSRKRYAILLLMIVVSVVSLLGIAMQEGLPWPSVVQAHDDPNVSSPNDFLNLLSNSRVAVTGGLTNIEAKWHPGNRVMLLEVLRFCRNPMAAREIVELLQRKTGQTIGQDLGAWYRTIWSDAYAPHPRYTEFKAQLYEKIDPRFREYFVEDTPATIRLDEVRWGGVRRDGIPPLKNPETLPASKATYLEDTDIVFGVRVNGEARAYPQRILAWHEMVKDSVGDVSINGVYCTLCGSMIVYLTETPDGKHYELGTSGFLFRSNKLMYDNATKSLWSTIEGKPVVGALVDKNIQLQSHDVVTTTWGKWKALHPDTSVLSLNTGHHRDYGEGVAYRDYFATDDLMFEVPKVDDRLKNKDEVVIVRRVNQQQRPLAISLRFLRSHPVYHDSHGNSHFVVLTDETGANRVYEVGAHEFVHFTESSTIFDADGIQWKITEEALVRRDASIRLPRLPAHRAFWFGWFAAHPDTRLVQ